MKKLTLDQLEIENIAIKLSEKELTQVKGGTTVPCAHSILAIPVIPGTNWNISPAATPVCKSLTPPLPPKV